MAFVQLVTVLALVSLLVCYFLYLATLQKALKRCSEQSRTGSPGSVWLMLIPLFSLGYQFAVVIRVANSLGNEFTRRGLANEPRAPGESLGILMGVLINAALLTRSVPIVGTLMAFTAIGFWIVYWIEIAGYSTEIATPFSESEQLVTDASHASPALDSYRKKWQFVSTPVIAARYRDGDYCTEEKEALRQILMERQIQEPRLDLTAHL